MSNCRAESPCTQPGGCTCGLHDWKKPEEKENTEKPVMTSNQAFVKAIRTVDEAIAALVESSKEPALRFAHDLTTIAPLFDVMTESQAHIVGEYLDAEMSASNAKIQEAVKNAFA